MVNFVSQLPPTSALGCSLDTFQNFGFKRADKLIRMAVGMGYIDPGRVRSICDFGAGSGGPTLALRNIFDIGGGGAAYCLRKRSSLHSKIG